MNEALHKEPIKEKKIVERLLDLPNKLNLDFIKSHLRFILWIVFFLILYIGNGHKANKLIRKINKLNTEVKKMKYEFLIFRSELTDLTQQGKLKISMEKINLKPLEVAPIVLNDSLEIETIK